MSNPIRERIARINLAPHIHYARGWVMRVWRLEDKDKHFEANRTEPDGDIIQRIQSCSSYPHSPYDLALKVLDLERITAVEVVDIAGAGDIVYREEET